MLAVFQYGCNMTELKTALANSANVETIEASSYITGKKSGVFAYLAAPTATTVTTAGTYVPISGTFTNDPIQDFITVADPAIQYKGTKTQYYKIDWQASCSCNNTGRTVKIGIKKNAAASPLASSVMETYLKVANETQALAGCVVVELATDDKIQLVVTSSVNGDQITFANYTTSIEEFFD